MTVSAQTPINRSTGNGVTTVFPYTFKSIAAADIEVTVDDVVKTLNVDYTLSGVGVDAGGNVTMTTAPANGTSVVRRRNMALTRTTDYQDQGELPATTLDDDIDAVVLMIQQVDEQTSRAMLLPIDVVGFSAELPTPVANYFLRVNSAGTALELAAEMTPGALTVTPFIETLLNDSTAADARTTLGAQVAGSYAAAGANTDITSLASPAIAAATATTQVATDNSTKVATTAHVKSAVSLGQCYLSLSGGNLKLSPFQGNNLTINGIANTVPSAGITLAPAGLTPATLYYIYAYMNAGTMTLEASTTGHSVDATTGVEIKTGDATRTLVGMAYPTTGPVFVDSGNSRLVLSWFNQRIKEAVNTSISGGTTASASYVELNSADRQFFLTWGLESIVGDATISASSSSSSSTWTVNYGLDGVQSSYANFNGGTATGGPISLAAIYFGKPAEGFHYATPMGSISGGATLTYQGGGTSAMRTITKG